MVDRPGPHTKPSADNGASGEAFLGSAHPLWRLLVYSLLALWIFGSALFFFERLSFAWYDGNRETIRGTRSGAPRCLGESKR